MPSGRKSIHLVSLRLSKHILHANIENRVVIGVTAEVSLRLLLSKPSLLRSNGFRPAFVASPGRMAEEFAQQYEADFMPVPMEREIAPARDVLSLVRLCRIFRGTKPALIDFGTPKAGLLGMVAGWLTRVPCRVYTLRGLRLETAQGPKRRILMATERVACKCAHRVICISPSLRQRAIELGLTNPQETIVLGKGSRGLEAERFSPTVENLARAEEARRELGLPKGVPVIGFVGRFTKDKGISELMDAYDVLRSRYPELRLLLVGDFEEGDPVPQGVRERIEKDANVVRPGFVADTSPYYHLMDLLALPTYREGFPGVPLEAQAAGKPVVTTSATGAVDSVLDGKTGLVVPVGDAAALARAMGSLLEDRAKRDEMGRAGQEWVRREFDGNKVREALVREYKELIREKLGPTGRLSSQRGWRGSIKRSVDFVCAGMGLVAVSPVLAVAALAIRVTMGGPVLFRQERPGKCGRPFRLVKFRTMTEAKDADGRLLEDGARLTRLGRWLRASSVDELPQLWNVVKGEMSLVGPRPLLMEYMERYTAEQARRHEVMPGITGWAQINGRNAVSWEEKFAADVWYVEHWGLWLDAKILLRTFWMTAARRGINQPGQATVEYFQGSPEKASYE